MSCCFGYNFLNYVQSGGFSFDKRERSNIWLKATRQIYYYNIDITLEFCNIVRKSRGVQNFSMRKIFEKIMYLRKNRNKIYFSVFGFFISRISWVWLFAKTRSRDHAQKKLKSLRLGTFCSPVWNNCFIVWFPLSL